MNKEILKDAGFTEEVERIEKNLCPICAKKINLNTEFKDALSKKEFKISGLCNSCQNKIFN